MSYDAESLKQSIQQRYGELTAEIAVRRTGEHKAYNDCVLNNPLLTQDEAMLRINRYNRQMETADQLERACAMAQATLEIYGPLKTLEDMVAWQPALDLASFADLSGATDATHTDEYIGATRYPLNTRDNEAEFVVDYASMGMDLLSATKKLEQGGMTDAQFILSALNAILRNTKNSNRVDQIVDRNLVATFEHRALEDSSRKIQVLLNDHDGIVPSDHRNFTLTFLDDHGIVRNKHVCPPAVIANDGHPIPLFYPYRNKMTGDYALAYHDISKADSANLSVDVICENGSTEHFSNMETFAKKSNLQQVLDVSEGRQIIMNMVKFIQKTEPDNTIDDQDFGAIMR